MANDPVRIIPPGERTSGAPTAGMDRQEAVATDGMWAGFVVTEPEMESGWHHHGDYESTIYVISGSLQLESGPGGADVLDAGPGDFVYVPKHVIHRERTLSAEPATAVVVRAGTGDPVTNVDGPAPA